MNISRHARTGFSLIEILIALAIVGIVAVVGLGSLKYLEKAKKSTAKQTLRSMKIAIESFYSEVGEYPESLDDLIKKPMNEELAKDWDGPYIEEKTVPKDPWKKPYNYAKTPSAEHPYELYSYGPSGRTAPESERISVWGR